MIQPPINSSLHPLDASPVLVVVVNDPADLARATGQLDRFIPTSTATSTRTGQASWSRESAEPCTLAEIVQGSAVY